MPRTLSGTTTALPTPWRRLQGLALAVGAAAVASWSLLAAHPAQAAGDCTVAASEVAIDAEEQAMLNGINVYRQQYGLVALSFSPTLNRAAAWQSHDMAAKRYFAHNDSLGRTFDVRLADCGYAFNTYRVENVAAGNPDAATTLTQWKNSPSHNAAILGSVYRAAGIGRYYDATAPYRWYWTLNLGGYVDSNAIVAPTTAPILPTATTPPTATPIPAVTTTAPAAPSNLRLGTATTNSLTVLWTDNATNETYYQLAYRAVTASTWTYVTTSANATSYVMSGLSANTSYYVYMQACNTVGCSAWVGPVTGQTTTTSVAATATSIPPTVVPPTATKPPATAVPPTATRTATRVPTAAVVQPSPTSPPAPTTSGGRVAPTPLVR